MKRKFSIDKLKKLGKPIKKEKQKSKVYASASGVMSELPEFEKTMKEIYDASKNSKNLKHQHAKKLMKLQDVLWQKAIIEQKTISEISKELNMKDDATFRYLTAFAIPIRTSVEKLRLKWKNDPEFRKRMNNKTKAQWEDPKFREKQKQAMEKLWQDEEFRGKKSKEVKEMWEDEEFRQMMSDKMKEQSEDPEFITRRKKGNEEKWKDEEFREKYSKQMKERWKDPEFRKKMYDSMWGDPEFVHKMTVESSKKAKAKFANLPFNLQNELKDIYVKGKFGQFTAREWSEAMTDWWAKVEQIEPVQEIPFKKTKKRVKEEN